MTSQLVQQKTKTIGHLVEELGKATPGEEVKIHYERDGKKETARGPITSKKDHCLMQMEKSTEDGGTIIRMRMRVAEEELLEFDSSLIFLFDLLRTSL